MNPRVGGKSDGANSEGGKRRIGDGVEERSGGGADGGTRKTKHAKVKLPQLGKEGKKGCNKKPEACALGKTLHMICSILPTFDMCLEAFLPCFVPSAPNW